MTGPILPLPGNHNAEELEQHKPFAVYGWNPPLCPYCGSWLRQVDMRPRGLPFRAASACPYFHGLLVGGQTSWRDLKPPKARRGSDGAWWTTLTTEQLQQMAETDC